MGIALREVFAKFGVQFDTSAVVAGKESVEQLEGKIATLKKNLDTLQKGSTKEAATKQITKLKDELAKLEGSKSKTGSQKIRIDEIKKALDHLESGRAATETAAEIQKLSAEIARLEGQKGIKATADEMAELRTQTGTMAAGLLAGVVAIGAFTQAAVTLGLSLGDTSREMGTSATEMRGWQMVAEEAGVPVEAMNTALQHLGQNLRDAANRTNDARYLFRRLHVEWSDGNGAARDTSVVMMEAGRAIASIGNPVLRARLGARAMGDSWRQLAPIFEGSGASIDDMRASVRDLVGGDLEELTAQSRRVRGAQAQFGLSLQALQATIAIHLIPVLEWLLRTGARVIGGFKQWLDTTGLLRTGLVLLGVAGAAALVKLGASALAAFGPAILSALPLMLLLTAMVLVVEDLTSLFEGGPSAIGDWIDAFGGAGAAAEWVSDIKFAGVELMTWLREQGPEIRDFFAHFTDYARGAKEAISAFFHDLFVDIMNGLFEGIPGYTRRAHAGVVSNAPGTTETPDGRLHTALSPAVLARIAAQQSRVAPGSAATGPAQGNVSVATHVGQIVVQAAENPEATATAVHARMTGRHEEDIRAARRHLVPAVRSTR